MSGKQYEFHSELSPELVHSRLSVHERRMSALDDGATSVQFLKDGSFYLLQTPSKLLRNRRVACPFHGSVHPEGTGCRIIGQFGLPARTAAAVFTVVMLLVLLAETLLGFWESPGFAVFSLMLTAVFALLYLDVVSRLGDSGQKRETLQFIKDNLLHE